MKKVTLGGDNRIGSGNKMKVEIQGFERSTHDLSHKWTSTMASGTLVPCLKQLLMPGDTFDIEMNMEIMTHPTIGPLFDSYKAQLDLYYVPFRFYNNKLMMNAVGQGLKMSEVILPQLQLYAQDVSGMENPDNMQIGSSHVLKYLGIAGLGHRETGDGMVARTFNAIPYLAYFDIYKTYYANLQEEVGYIIHNDMEEINVDITSITWYGITKVTPPSAGVSYALTEGITQNSLQLIDTTGDPNDINLIIQCTDLEEFDLTTVKMWIGGSGGGYKNPMELFETVQWNLGGDYIAFGDLKDAYKTEGLPVGYYVFENETEDANNVEPKMYKFDLSQIDLMRKTIFFSETGTVQNIQYDESANFPWAIPYTLPMKMIGDSQFGLLNNQEGLLVKTYQADANNAWVNTDWIEGSNGINEVTAINVVDDKVLVNEINVKQRIYNMLMKVGVSGGTIDDWQDSIYDHKRPTLAHQPVYVGGLSKELGFQEVISNSASETEDVNQPLGTLAGRGRMTSKHKGGSCIVRADEHAYLIGIVSLTPRIGYSQGNDWDMNLKNIDQIHKPDLDQIGFEDKITDTMAFWDTGLTANWDGAVTFKKAGKQPAWINYMTETNKIKGNFAEKYQQQYMVLARRYENNVISENAEIKDLTTYIDPSHYNHIFADTRRDAQNFWCQIGWGITARRKMSAKLMPRV